MGLISLRLRTNVQPLGRSVRAMSLISRNSGLSTMSASSYRQSRTSGRSNRSTRTPGAAVSIIRFPLTLNRIVSILRQRLLRAPVSAGHSARRSTPTTVTSSSKPSLPRCSAAQATSPRTRSPRGRPARAAKYLHRPWRGGAWATTPHAAGARRVTWAKVTMSSLALLRRGSIVWIAVDLSTREWNETSDLKHADVESVDFFPDLGIAGHLMSMPAARSFLNSRLRRTRRLSGLTSRTLAASTVVFPSRYSFRRRRSSSLRVSSKSLILSASSAAWSGLAWDSNCACSCRISCSRCNRFHFRATLRFTMVTARAMRSWGPAKVNLFCFRQNSRLRWTDWTRSAESTAARRAGPNRRWATRRTSGSYSSTRRAMASGSPWRARANTAAKSCTCMAVCVPPVQGGGTLHCSQFTGPRTATQRRHSPAGFLRRPMARAADGTASSAPAEKSQIACFDLILLGALVCGVHPRPGHPGLCPPVPKRRCGAVRGPQEGRSAMKEIFPKDDSCESRRGRIDLAGFIQFLNPAIRHVLHEVPTPDEVERSFPIPSLGDTLMPSDNNHEQLENRLRRAKLELERRIPAGEECSAEEYFKADPELAADVDSAIDLVYTEYTARKDAGRPLPPEHYYGQHAQLRNKLEPLFLLDDEFDESHPTRVIRILGADGQREQYQVLKEISQSPNGNID